MKENHLEIFPITRYGESILTQPGTVVAEFGSDLKAFIDKFLKTLRHVQAVGLAAHHVGRALQVCLIDLQDLGSFSCTFDGKTMPGALLMPLVLVNPQIHFYSDEIVEFDEASVSFPGIYCPKVKRPEFIKVRFQDSEGAFHELECGGFLSRVIQHEVDQALGKLFIHCLDRKSLLKLEPKLKQIKRETKALLKKGRVRD